MGERRTDPIVQFYRGEAPDAEGRRIEAIWAWGHGELEVVHDYVQWLFPLREPSGFNHRAPLVQPATIAAFEGDAALRERLVRSLDVMLDFYGLVRRPDEEGRPAIAPAPGFAERKGSWFRPRNHNFLRLTRILASLRLLGLPEYAEALFGALQEVCRREGFEVAGESLGFWRRAAHG